ncbi:putative prophage protein [Escherichia coli]|nr:putative prophage protein [Escherichia coli]
MDRVQSRGPRSVRALLTPEIAPRMGVVLLRPGTELMPLFRRGRVLIEPEPEHYAGYETGAIPPATQLLAEDPTLIPVFENEEVITKAGGIGALEAELERTFKCQYPHGTWHSGHFTLFRHHPGSIRLCWSCDNIVRDQFTQELAGIARKNLVSWLISVIRARLGFNEDHSLTIPELCWWLVINDLGHVIPESLARKALRLPEIKHQSVMKESELQPELAATEIVHKKILELKVDAETPESFMLRPKRRRWVNEKYTRWVKSQKCVCCNQPADDPHHLIGHGQGGMGTKAHDMFVMPLCRAHHDELHADTVAFEEKYGSQLELLFRFLDRSLAIGVLA